MSGQYVPGSPFSPASAAGVPSGPAVTRLEVVDHVGGAFAAGPLTRSDLITEAQRAGARPAVVELLGRLPDHKFTRPNELWTNLTDVPIEP